MLCEKDVKWLLENLPKDLVCSIIASYNPSCFFMMDGLLDHDWSRQCRLTFGFPHQSSIYTYYNLWQNQRPIHIACGESMTVISQNDKILWLGSDDFINEKRLCVDLKAITVVCGDVHTIIMTSDRKLFGKGYTYPHYQLGEISTYKEFGKISNTPDDIVQVGCGHDYSAVLTSNGTAMICGRDYKNYVNNEFREMELPKDIIKIACGRCHMFALRSDGTLLVCGSNDYGQLGIGGRSYQKGFIEPKNIPKDIIQIECRGNSSFILRSDGTLMSCGANIFGQLGHNDKKHRDIFTEITGLPKDIIQIASGRSHVVILRKNGTLMSCGCNNSGQLGLGDYESRKTFTVIKNVEASQIACGEYHTVILGKDGTLMGCGNNMLGQLVKVLTNKFEKITVCGQ